MKKITLILLFISSLISENLDIQKAVAIGIFNENGVGENIQHLTTTKNDYNGTCFSKIVIFGNLNNSSVKVKIGNSRGHFIKASPIYNDKKLLIGKEITFKHYNINKGYFEVKIDNKLYDSKVFIK